MHISFVLIHILWLKKTFKKFSLRSEQISRVPGTAKIELCEVFFVPGSALGLKEKKEILKKFPCLV